MSAVPPARVYLVRHGSAEASAASDAARRLTADGRAAFAAHARALAPRLAVTRVVTSPYLRARETADLLADVTGATVEEEPGLAAGRSSGREVLALARRLGGGVALVGHNPELAEAVALLAGSGPALRPGAVAALDLDPGGERLAWLEEPGGG